MKQELIAADYSIWEIAQQSPEGILFCCIIHPVDADPISFIGKSDIDALTKAHTYIFYPGRDPMRLHHTKERTVKNWFCKLFSKD